MKKYLLLFAFVSAALTTIAQDVPKGLMVNDDAPAFSAKNQNGKMVSLKEELKKGAVVLVFYRGQWCPYCNKHLKKLEDSLSLITAKGASLITITPEKPENISKTIEKTKASYSILYDDGLKIMKSYDVAFAVDEKTVEKYKGYGIDFTKANGENGANLPVPALYIIGMDGKIAYRYFDTDYSKRASVAEILAHL
jgi:peroxiredoxin